MYPWVSTAGLQRSLVSAAVVGSIVGLGHVQAPGAPWWPAVHALLPSVVFTVSAIAAGHRRVTRVLFVRGVVVTCVVATAFTWLAKEGALPEELRVLLGYAVPFTVSLVAGGCAVTHRQS